MNKQINKLINHSTDKSSHRKCSIKEDVFENSEKFTEKHLCQSIFFNKVPGSIWHKCFPLNFAKCLRIPILKNICKRLLLNRQLSR